MKKGKVLLKILRIFFVVFVLSAIVYFFFSVRQLKKSASLLNGKDVTQAGRTKGVTCSRIDLLELKVLIPHVSVRKADMPGYILNNPCLPTEIKRTYEKSIALYSKKSNLEAQILKDYCLNNPKDCKGGNVFSFAGKEKYWALRDAAENADSDFERDEDDFYLIERDYLNTIHNFIFSD